MNSSGSSTESRVAMLGGVLVAVMLVLGTLWMGSAARRDTEQAVHAVSSLYLDELAGRREQVVSSNIQDSIDTIQTAIALLTADDLSDTQHLQAYQRRMKLLYSLDKFAFVDSNGLIYTALGTQDNIDDYSFDYQRIVKPEVSVLNLNSEDKKVVIAVPVDLNFEGQTLVVCFMEQDMDMMLDGVSMKAQDSGATFCNIYTSEGIALSNTVLGGLAVEDNLLEALKQADFEGGASYEGVAADFAAGREGQATFTYNGIRETLSYAPVQRTDWLLTYLVRESVISDQIGSFTSGLVVRSVVQSLLTVAVLVGLFTYLVSQIRKNNLLRLTRETEEAENRARSEELERRLALQEQLLEDEKYRTQQSQMITALASDYRAVYYLDLDADEGVCYQSHEDLDKGLTVGEHFPYLSSVTAYANEYITEQYRDEFIRFVQPEAIREGLKQSRIYAFRYLVKRHDVETYEMVKFAGVRHPEDRDDHYVHAVGACFTDVDEETRKSLEQSEALSDALHSAVHANRAKTAFLSNMSHEIRTPMNAIIGLDSIALNDPETPEQTREYLEKIGFSANHLLGLINDILDMSRIESGRMMLKHEEFSFSKMLETINTIISGQCQDKGLEYQCRMTSDVASYYVGDGMKLRQVLINILGNAVKFTPEGGQVSLGVERKLHYEGKSTLCFTIADTGIGMSEEFLPHIFDTFAQEDSSSTNKYGSSGLGLAITKNIVEMMNGTIEVESAKGEGTTFRVFVTLMDSERSDSEGDFEIHASDMSVLIVDDDPVACEHARLVLEKAGIKAEIVDSGKHAIEMVEVRHARRDPYNLILMDWKMPDVDGVEATRRIRSLVGNESAIIFLTAYRWDDVLEEAVKAGVDGFIPKPLFAETVIEEFKSAMKQRQLNEQRSHELVNLAGKRVLLAEDVEINADIMVMVLEMREIETEIAENGRIAVDKFAEKPAGYYDAILMDMRMPEMDGLEATKTIRAMDREDAKSIPIIALTANAFDEDVQRSLQAGLNAHLTKPVEPDDLFETLESLIKD